MTMMQRNETAKGAPPSARAAPPPWLTEGKAVRVVPRLYQAWAINLDLLGPRPCFHTKSTVENAVEFDGR